MSSSHLLAAIQQQARPQASPAMPGPPGGLEPGEAIDISNYTTGLTPASIRCLRQHGVRLAIVRASLEENRGQAAIAAAQLDLLVQERLPFAAYAWCYFDWDPRDLVDRTVALLAPYRAHYAGGQILWLDAEDIAPGRAATIQWLQVAVDRVIECGYVPGIYTGQWWWQPVTGDSQAFSALPLWVAYYDNLPDRTVWAPFGGWRAPTIKQYAGTTTRCGVANIDLNIC